MGGGGRFCSGEGHRDPERVGRGRRGWGPGGEGLGPRVAHTHAVPLGSERCSSFLPTAPWSRSYFGSWDQPDPNKDTEDGHPHRGVGGVPILRGQEGPHTTSSVQSSVL